MSAFVSLKVRFGEEIRRVTIDKASASFDGLVQTVSKLISQPAEGLIIKYVDNEGDNVLITSDEEFTEALRATEKSGVVNVNVSSKTGLPNFVPSTVPGTVPHRRVHGKLERKGCKILRHFGFNCGTDAPAEANAGPCGPCPGRGRCHKIFMGVVLSIVAFKVISWLAAHFFCLALFILAGAGIKHFIQRRRAACAQRFAAHGGCPFAAVAAAQANAQAPAPAQCPVAAPAPVVAPVAAPAVSPAAPEQPKHKLIDMLKQLEDMGFADKNRNISILIENNLNLAATIQTLLGQQ